MNNEKLLGETIWEYLVVWILDSAAENSPVDPLFPSCIKYFQNSQD